jgi:hypothetical protein
MRPEGDRDRGTGPDAERWQRVRELFHEVVDRDEEEWPELRIGNSNALRPEKARYGGAC